MSFRMPKEYNLVSHPSRCLQLDGLYGRDCVTLHLSRWGGETHELVTEYILGLLPWLNA